MHYELFRNSVNVCNRFQTEVMIPFKGLHCLLLGFKKRTDDQDPILDFLTLGLPPKLFVYSTNKIIGIDQFP